MFIIKNLKVKQGNILCTLTEAMYEEENEMPLNPTFIYAKVIMEKIGHHFISKNELCVSIRIELETV